jgi:mono/diheme cytochrome c family protein
MKVFFLLTAGAFLLGTALAQSTGKSSWSAPADAATKKNPLAGKSELAAGGKKIFAKTCAVCHDSGEKQKGPNLSLAHTQQQGDGELFWKISNGNSRSGMPSFSHLPEGQRWQLVLYIRSLKQNEGY